MRADQTKANPPHSRSVRGLLRTKRGSRPNVCYPSPFTVHRYLFDEAAGTDARGPDESLLTPVRRERELIRQPRELDGGAHGPVR